VSGRSKGSRKKSLWCFCLSLGGVVCACPFGESLAPSASFPCVLPGGGSGGMARALLTGPMPGPGSAGAAGTAFSRVLGAPCVRERPRRLLRSGPRPPLIREARLPGLGHLCVRVSANPCVPAPFDHGTGGISSLGPVGSPRCHPSRSSHDRAAGFCPSVCVPAPAPRPDAVPRTAHTWPSLG